MKRRVVITGIGVISPIGIGKTAFWNGLIEGRSGIKPITQFDVSNFPVKFAGEVSEFDPLKFMNVKQARRLFRFSQFGLAAARLAIAEARLDLGNEDLDRIGISLGTSIGALNYPNIVPDYLEKGVDSIHPFFGSNVIPSSCATAISIEFKISGPVNTNTNACAASTTAIGSAFHLVREGSADTILAGGAEAPVSEISMGGLVAAKIMSEEQTDPLQAYMPFSKGRKGVVVGEGAAFIVLESLDHAQKRNAPVLAEMVGYGNNCDAYHPLLQPPDGEKALQAIHVAMNDAQLKPESIDYVNAHGSGTPMNDKTETLIIKKVFGDRAHKIPISTTKSMIGHAMGACGALELAACVLMLENQYLHPTINLHRSDPDCDLDYIPNVGRNQNVDALLKLSFGFGGYNAACILKRFI